MAIYYINHPPAQPTVLGGLVGIIGLVQGGYYGWIHNGALGDVVPGAASFAGGTMFSFFGAIGDWLLSLAPHSDAMFWVAFFIKFILGSGCAIFAFVGGLIGGGITWTIWDISHHLGS
jgi:hypothetical protein